MAQNAFKKILRLTKQNDINIFQHVLYFLASHKNRRIQFSILKSVQYFFKKEYFEASEILENIKYKEIPVEYDIIITKLKLGIYRRLVKLHEIKKLIEDKNEIFDTYILHKKAEFMFSSARMYWWTNFSEKLGNSPYPYFSFEEVKDILEKSIDATNTNNRGLVSRIIKYVHTNVFLIHNAVEKDNADLAIELIENLLLKLGINPEEPLYTKTKDLIVNQLTTEQDISEQKKEYESYLSNFNLEEFNNTFYTDKKYSHLALWLSIEWLLQANGFFHASIFARRNATESFLSMGCIKDKDYLSAMIEKGELNRAKNIIRCTKSRNQTSRKFLAYISLLQGEKIEYISRMQKIFQGYSLEFDEYVTNKHLAIVGPAVVENNGSLIDACDVVIRMNSLGEPPIDIKSYGSKTDVVSYNVEKLARFKNAGDKQLLPNVKFALTKSNRFNDGIQGLEDITITKYDFSSCMLPATWLVHAPMLIPFLYAYNASDITLFNANFFISDPENAYSKEYNRNISFKSIAFMDNHIVGFRLAKQMYDSGVFKADNTAKKILTMSESEYAKSMENLYQPERIKHG